MALKITVAPAAGFCFGVQKAIDTAENMDEAFIFGSLIHNPQEVARLDATGKHIVHDLKEVKSNQVVITAHGLDVHKIDAMKKKNFDIIDTTCPLVTHIYKAGLKFQSEGLQVIIIGDPSHVEVKGIASRMINPIIIYKNEELNKVPQGSKIGVICQSTLLQTKLANFITALQERCDEVHYVDTICKPTKDRQDSALALSKEVDVMIVIGGYNSSNTRKLADVAMERVGLESTHHIETADQLDPTWFADKKHAGVTAGASTPDYLIKQVVAKIQTFNPQPATA